MTTLGTIQEPIINPWAFDSAEAGCFLIQDRYLAGFNRAVDGFYRSLSTESSYRRVSYSQLKFGSANDMALFLGSLREMRPAVPDQEKDDAGPLVYFDLHGNSAGIWDSRWPTNELEDALWEMRVRSAF